MLRLFKAYFFIHLCKFHHEWGLVSCGKVDYLLMTSLVRCEQFVVVLKQSLSLRALVM